MRLPSLRAGRPGHEEFCQIAFFERHTLTLRVLRTRLDESDKSLGCECVSSRLSRLLIIKKNYKRHKPASLVGAREVVSSEGRL
jgi:hypothetical protein